MASREEEKRKRREERMAVEQEAASAQSRRKRIQAAIIALVVIAAVVIGVVALAGGSGGGNSGNEPDKATGPAAKIPAPQEKDLSKAATAAGCVMVNPPIEGREHTTAKVTYKSNPPTSGNHNPDPALDGIYEP